MVVAFVGYGVLKQAHPDSVISQNSDPASSLVGTWQEIIQSSQDNKLAAKIDFQSNGTFAVQTVIPESQVGSVIYTTELYGIYRMTGQNSFVRTMQKGRIAVDGNWHFYCPSSQNSNSNGTCDGLFNGLEKDLGRPMETSFKIDSSTQELVIDDNKYRRIR
jgi:hypothetical protein